MQLQHLRNTAADCLQHLQTFAYFSIFPVPTASSDTALLMSPDSRKHAFVKVVDSSNSEIGTTMKNNNKFANLLQSNKVNSSSRQVKSLTSITATKTHTAHLTLTGGKNSHNYNLRQFEQHDNLNTTGFIDKRKYRYHIEDTPKVH